MLPSSQRERRVSRLNRTGNNKTGWARRLTALLVTACLVMAMALPVYAEVDLLPDAPDEVELLEDKPGTDSGEDTTPPEQNAATPVPDAATPEPEQSAEPEQPAPTETPEPTAEPTPTPEPTATATATPVPTVTPTATPEPTEQPQKMYAARSVGNVQAVSATGVPATYKLYFAVPSSWSDCTRVIIYAVATNDTTKDPYTLEMQEDGKTGDGRKIYSADLNKDKHYPYGGLNGLEFHGYKGDTLEDSVVIADVNTRTWWRTFDPTRDDYIGGNYYDAEGAEGEKWSTYTVTVRHNQFAGKEMSFENKTGEKLTNVQAWFYEPNDKGELIQVGGPIPLNSAESDSGIAPNSTATFTIPNELCSYVKFTWGEDNPQQSSKIYNFYGEDVSGVSGDDKKSFTYNSDTRNCFIYTGEDNERWGIEKSVLIYYDATFSKLPTGDTGDYSIPKANESTVYYRLKGENGKNSIGGTMSRMGDTDYYAADVPEGYTQIVFSSYPLSNDDNLAGCGDSTGWEKIPSTYKDTEQCFYADTNDDVVYGKGVRGGYWAPKGTPRDAEKWKKTKVVDIDDTAEFTEDPNTKYVTSTLYDYYTDYELNGKNRDNYKDNDNKASHRNWVTFREFDQALSDYYSNSGTTVPYPMYTGQFQPDAVGADGNEWGIRFSEIADKLNLYGYTDKKLFMAVNNSTSDRNGKGLGQNDEKLYDETFQGLAGPELKNGKPIMNGTTDLAMPFFNEEFLQGENSKKAKLGNVYKEVSFPFTQDEVFKDTDDNEKGVKYWYFDSDKTTLYLKNNPDNGGYFLQKQDAQKSQSKNLKSDSTPVQVKKKINGEEKMVDTYGFFPFNSGASENQASTYNYGFGAKLQFQFTLTSDGTVKDDNGNNIPIKFFFSGDDDVWVYIDGKLALDVGGDHGKASGLLEFGADTNGNNNYTSYVSDIKESNNTVYGSGAEKTVTYLGNKITFKYKSKETTTLKPGTHTLTMYYMERGMWESNMAVAFNFPDNNELQVQKQVVLKNVDPEFQKCFTDKKIFNFTIQNQATHYGEKKAADPDTSGTHSQVVNLETSTIEPATPNNDAYIFEKADNPGPDSGTNKEKVLHWYARYMDTEPVSKWRKNRYGILTLKEPINIENERFLTFEVYVKHDDGGELSLNNLYLELLDEQTPIHGQKGSLGTSGINGATYGSVELKTDQWVTVKLDLHKMKEQGGSDGKFSGNVTTIRVGDNYSRNIYFRNFTFIPKAKPSTMSGFTTDQKDIPDYGSATTGHLENAENAQYTSNMDNDTQLVEGDGRFVLEDGETVTFSDQFRRGSYISLKEDLNQNLYDTTWTVCENGQAVAWTEPTGTSSSHVTFGTPRSLDGQKVPADGPDDDRTEVYVDEDGVKNDGYTKDEKPGTNTIVFRSYKDPDETSSTLTKLKVKYVNTVKTGGLKIQKKAAAGEVDNIKGTYKFKVTFNDVGGEGLEKKDIIKYVEINMSDGNNPEHTVTITGIPVGTRYTIEEETPEDKSRLQSVTVPPNCHSAQEIGNTMVEGVIVASEDPELTAIFTNTQRKLINIEFDKLWKDANDTVLGTTNQPNEIYIQLQRRLANSAEDAPWDVVDYPTSGSKYVTVHHTDNGWLYPFNNLDQYPVGGSADNNYIYRIVEGTVEKGEFKQAAEDGTITIDGKTYVVTAEATANSETNSENGATTTPATAPDGTITGGSGKIVLTNTLQNPKFVLDIIKKDAEKGENNKDVPLGGVEFKLEKLVETTEGETQWVVDESYPFDSANIGSITATTNGSGEITNMFTDLEPGTYRLTETKAHPGYNLLAQPIVIKFTQGGECYIDEQLIKGGDKFKPGANNTYTLTLTVLNRKTPELPHTGADAPSLWLLIGMPLAVAGLLIFTFRYNRKGGRRH